MAQLQPSFIAKPIIYKTLSLVAKQKYKISHLSICFKHRELLR